MNNLDSFNILFFGFLVLIICGLTVPDKSFASEQVCTQFSDNRISCQNYNDSNQYTGQTDYQRNGNTNTFNGTDSDYNPKGQFSD